MAALGVGSGQLLRRHALANLRRPCSSCADQHMATLMLTSRSTLRTPIVVRNFSSRSNQRPRFSQRLGEALRNSKITWYHIPVGVGIGFLGLVQFYKVTAREQEKQRQADGGAADQPKRRQRIRPEGPWQVQVMSTLPLKAISRLWGKFNELTIPYYLRVPGFKLYSFIFGVNLDEVSEPDLHIYPNLAAFFYRTLKPGARPLDPDSHALLSPSDGKLLQYGRIEGGDIEQVKGMTYSVDALLGQNTPTASIASGQSSVSDRSSGSVAHGDEAVVRQEEEFAKMNGISYTLPDLLSGQADSQGPHRATDESTEVSARAVSEVRAELALGEKPWYDVVSADKSTSLYYAVIYLAPGDYHRFHSPTDWVVERRRHFAGELYSVSPYLQRTLPGLFTLNERVVLLGRWRYGFFGYVPVGATNVGSIRINFDRELRTNSLLTDTAAGLAAEQAAERGEPYTGFAEATYEGASPVLHGHALRRGEEMGGFQLGSTIVLVFEAPSEKAQGEGKPASGWHWAVDKGQTVKMGQALGRVVEQ
ncbi:phosphatidylserine decarboxylase 1 [Metarhizium rileyi]|uniref:Phosphatidylserine decarboxylase proenzyme 1, mitochondrial n=1 Tax=Metarhizium rileyi (strain RCEF 4871) TaxID=1649241 RepID=A0A5C6GFM8_METRR|nr:phosphatidylserine decarboxylase 1 [Metarhizium rileyi]